MPKSTNILMVRHGEKPDTGPDLTVAGQERAQAYVVYFQNYSVNANPIKLNYLFAAADSSESERPRLTIEPLSNATGLDIDATHKDKDYQKVADDILGDSKYDNSNILICWHHGEILLLAAALGVNASTLPPASNWPNPKWPGHVFGWLLQICYDSNGNLVLPQTFCISEQMMYGDYGQAPPTG